MTLRERLVYEAEFFKTGANLITLALWISAAVTLYLNMGTWWADLNHTMWLLHTILTVLVALLLVALMLLFQYAMNKAETDSKSKVSFKITSERLNNMKQFRYITIAVGVGNVLLLYMMGYTVLGAITLTSSLTVLALQPVFRSQLRRLTMLKLRGVIASS